MSAPSSFQLSPAPEGLHVPPSPPQRLKPQIYQNVDVFKNVDEHAIAVSVSSCFDLILCIQNSPAGKYLLLVCFLSVNKVCKEFISCMI